MVVNKVFEVCARTLFHFALRALPGAFRARHGGEMRWTFEQRLLESADSRLFGRMALVVRELCGVLAAAGSARRAEHAVHMATHVVRFSQRTLLFLEDLRFDLAFAFRQFGRSPLFTVVAVLVLALGIGVNAATEPRRHYGRSVCTCTRLRGCLCRHRGVAQRKREIGIRRSLGARDGQVVGLFFRDGMRLAMIGLVVGVPAALALMKATMSRVLGIDMLTPDAVATIILILLTVAALASWLPARRASAVDPLDALRQD